MLQSIPGWAFVEDIWFTLKRMNYRQLLVQGVQLGECAFNCNSVTILVR